MSLIKPIQSINFNSGFKIGKHSSIPSFQSNTAYAYDVFEKTQNPIEKLEDELADIGEEIEQQQAQYKKMCRQLDASYGYDWIFCYDDLNDMQSNLYVDIMGLGLKISQLKQNAAELKERIDKLKGLN